MSSSTGDVRPSLLSENDITRVVLEVYGHNVKLIKEFDSYYDRNYLVQDVSFSIDPRHYMFKVLNAVDSKEPRKIAVHNEIIVFVKQTGYPLSAPLVNLEGSYQKLVPFENKERGITETSLVLLYEYLPGTALDKVALTKPLCRQIGHFAGLFDKVCQDYSKHDDAVYSTMPPHAWNLSQLPILWSLLDVVEDSKQLALLKNVISAFETDVIKNEDKFTHKGFIHNDVTDSNLIVSAGPVSTKDNGSVQNGMNGVKTREENGMEETYHMSGVIDFGDMTYSYHLYEVAISIVYVIINEHGIPPLEAAGCVLSGFLKQIKLSDFELDRLKTCVCARITQSIVMSRNAAKSDPENTHILNHSSRMWTPLQKLWAMTGQEFLQELYKEMK